MASKVTAYSSPKNIGGRTNDAGERIFVLNDIWNTSEAKQAKDSLDYFVIDKSGRAKPDKDWITGPINRQTLPALKQKAGTDPKKLRQIQEIERLLKISEGG